MKILLNVKIINEMGEKGRKKEERDGRVFVL